MTTKVKIIVSIVALVTAFAFGRYTTPTKTITEVKTTQATTQNNTHQSDLHRDRHRETTVVETTNKDGTTTKTTKIVEDDKAQRLSNSEGQKETTSTQDRTKEVVKSSSQVTISALAGYHLGDTSPTYGAAVSKPVLGPITLGAFFLTNKTFGASIGLTF